jgi:hypothetical protein
MHAKEAFLAGHFAGIHEPPDGQQKVAIVNSLFILVHDVLPNVFPEDARLRVHMEYSLSDKLEDLSFLLRLNILGRDHGAIHF